MSLLDRFRRKRRTHAPAAPTSTSKVAPEAEKHLREFITSRRGVEGFVEPRTAVSGFTLLLVAYDGEWTRRQVPSVKWAHEFCNKLGAPSYDAGLVGIPKRMREYQRRQSQSRKRDQQPPTD